MLPHPKGACPRCACELVTLRRNGPHVAARCARCTAWRGNLTQTGEVLAALPIPREVLLLEDPTPEAVLELGLRLAARRDPQLVARVLAEELGRGGDA